MVFQTFNQFLASSQSQMFDFCASQQSLQTVLTGNVQKMESVWMPDAGFSSAAPVLGHLWRIMTRSSPTSSIYFLNLTDQI